MRQVGEGTLSMISQIAVLRSSAGARNAIGIAVRAKEAAIKDQGFSVCCPCASVCFRGCIDCEVIGVHRRSSAVCLVFPLGVLGNLGGSIWFSAHRQHELIQPLHESRRVFELAAFGEQRLIEQDLRSSRRSALRPLRSSSRCTSGWCGFTSRIGFEAGTFWPGGLEQALEVHAHVVLVGDEARR